MVNPLPKKALSFEALLGALAILSVDAGCTKRESAAPAPETKATPGAAAPSANVATPAPPPPSPDRAPTESAAANGGGAAAVDAGVEPAKTIKNPIQKGPNAACGASGCSPDMKKK